MRALLLLFLLAFSLGCSGGTSPVAGIWKLQDFQGLSKPGMATTSPAWVLTSGPSFWFKGAGKVTIGLNMGAHGRQVLHTTYSLKGSDLTVHATSATPEFHFKLAAGGKTMNAVKATSGDPDVIYAKEGRVEGEPTEKDLFPPM